MTKADKLEGKIRRKAALINVTLLGLLDDVVLLRSHTKNRIAAHKAHVTMAKKNAKLPVVKIPGI
jgi:hypothetical protein